MLKQFARKLLARPAPRVRPAMPFRLNLSELEARDVPVARIQFTQESPYAAAAAVDIYINNVQVFNDLAFRQSTAFINVPDSTPVKIDVVPGTATSNATPLSSQTVTLPANATVVAATLGNPSDTTTAGKFQLLIAPNGRLQAANAANVDVLVLNGAPDSPPITVKIRNVGPVASSVPTDGFANDYVSVPAGKYIFDVTLADGVTPVGSFSADLSGAAGKSYVLATSGFATPPAAATDPALGLLAVDATGTGTLLTRVAKFAETTFAVGGVGTASLYNAAGTQLFAVTPPAAGVPERVATADVDGDGVADLIVGSGPGVATVVDVYSGKTQAKLLEFAPFEATFTGGVFVAAGDLNNDGHAEIVVTPDQGGGPRVQIRNGLNGTQLVPDFFGIDDPNFRGGARAAITDLNGDGTPDLIVAAGFGGGPRVAGFNGLSLLPGGTPGRLFPDFFVFEDTLRNGVFVAGGDINGDGYGDLVAGGGPGGGPRVLALSGQGLSANGQQTPLANFFAGDANNRDGVRLAVKDLDGDYKADIVVGLGSPGVSQVRTFLGKNLTATATPPATLELNPLGGTALPTTGGVFVG